MIKIFERIKFSVYLRYWKLSLISKTEKCGKNLIVLSKISTNRCNKLLLGDNVTLYPNVSFNGSGEIIIGNNVQIGEGTILYSHKKIVIGDNVAIAGQCYIIDCNHGIKKGELIQNQLLEYDEEGIEIGNDVWIAAGCKIIKGAKIHNGCVIGALSLVNSEIDTNGIAVGVPAKLKKYRE